MYSLGSWVCTSCLLFSFRARWVHSRARKPGKGPILMCGSCHGLGATMLVLERDGEGEKEREEKGTERAPSAQRQRESDCSGVREREQARERQRERERERVLMFERQTLHLRTDRRPRTFLRIAWALLQQILRARQVTSPQLIAFICKKDSSVTVALLGDPS